MLETVEKYFFVSLNTNHKEARAKWFDNQQGFCCLQASHNNSSQHKHSCKNNYVENKELKISVGLPTWLNLI